MNYSGEYGMEYELPSECREIKPPHKQRHKQPTRAHTHIHTAHTVTEIPIMVMHWKCRQPFDPFALLIIMK